MDSGSMNTLHSMHVNTEIHMPTSFTFMHHNVCKFVGSEKVVFIVVMEMLKYTCLKVL